MISAEGYVVAAACHDPLSARLAEEAGFPVVWANGSSMNMTMLALPDMGLSTMSEAVDHAARITSAVTVPLVLDVDTGFGGPVNVARTVRACERAGVAAIHIEDQADPKMLPHFGDRQIVPRRRAQDKIRAAVDARTDEDFVIIGRSDADEISIGELIERCNLYLEAGADMAMPIVIKVDGVPRSQIHPDALMDVYARIAREVEGPTFAMSMSMPRGYNARDLGELGYKIVPHGGSSLYAALYAMRAGLNYSWEHGTMEGFMARLGSLIDGDDDFRSNPFMATQRILGIAGYADILERFGDVADGQRTR
jgi:2-methylisocitrate lyase-like PEP mutase family enzyme